MTACSAIIVAAGKSQRFQSAEQLAPNLTPTADARELKSNDWTQSKKPFVELLDGPVWMHSARQFQAHSAIRQIMLVIAEEDRDWVASRYQRFLEEGQIQLVLGGAERADSVENAVQQIDPACDFVLIHDAARPCIDLSLIDRVLHQAQLSGAAIPAVPVHSTLKRSDNGIMISQTVDRSQLYLAQTPQIFRRDWIQTAYSQRAGLGVTDDAQLLEHFGYPVALVEGSTWNLKITLPEDLILAETLLRLAKSRLGSDRGT